MEHTETTSRGPLRRVLAGLGATGGWILQSTRFMAEGQMAELQRQRDPEGRPTDPRDRTWRRRDEWR